MMDGVHDMGGMHGFGPVDPSPDEPLSKTCWRARMFGIELSYTQPGGFNLDWMRHVMECMPPAAYLSSEYFDRWYWRDAGILFNAGWVSIDELTTGKSGARPADAGDPLPPEAIPGMLSQGVDSRRCSASTVMSAPSNPATAGIACRTPAPMVASRRSRSTASASVRATCGTTWRRRETGSLPTSGRAILSRPEMLRPADAEFAEPWQAEALVLSIALQETGHVTPTEWSSTLSDEIEKARATGDSTDGTTYYQHVVAALERLVAEKGLVAAAALDQRRHDWEEAYRRTPHGQPVVLTKDAASD
jgi:nitrile hydratase accessory protein